jgi:hypothetical protein
MRAQRSPTEWVIRWLAVRAAQRLRLVGTSIKGEVEQQLHGCAAPYPFPRWEGLTHDYPLHGRRRRDGHVRHDAEPFLGERCRRHRYLQPDNVRNRNAPRESRAGNEVF